MNKKITLIAALLLYITNLNVFAQPGSGHGNGNDMPAIGVLKGKVIDQKTDQPIEYATISLHSIRDSSLVTGGITDAKGEFNISEIKLGRYFVKVGFIGYDTKIVKDVKFSPREGTTEQNLGDIKLAENSQVLEDVDVTAEKSIVTNSIDKKIFNVSQSFVSNASSATEVLENIPSIDVDIDGNVSLRGSSNLIILVDGKPSGMSATEILEQIPASSIESIEIITNPSAKYDPDGTAGILNIVLKKNKLKGFNGMFNVGIGTYSSYNAMANLSYRTQKFNIYANYGYHSAERRMEGYTYRENYLTSGNTIFEQDDEGSFRFMSQMGKVGLDLYLNDKNTLSLSGNYSSRSFARNSSDANMYYDGNFSLQNASERTSESAHPGTGYDLYLMYTKEFEKKGHELTIDAYQSKHSGASNGSFEENFFDAEYIQTGTTLFERDYNDFTNNIYTFKSDYVYPVTENSKFEAGAKAEFSTSSTDYYFERFDDASSDYVIDDTRNNYFDYQQNIFAAYLIYGAKFGKVDMQVGLRGEQTFTDFILTRVNENYKNQYFSLYPSVHFNYEFKKGEMIQVSYSRRVNRPHTHALNPNVDYSDPMNLRAGNPSLLPEYINSYDFGYAKYWKKASLTTSLYYKDIKGMITRIKTVDEFGVSLTTYDNIESGKDIGFEFVLNATPYKWWNMTLSSNVFQSIIDGSNLETEMNNSGASFQGKFMSTWKIPNIFDVQLSGRYRGPRIMPQGKSTSSFTIDAGIKKSILDKKGTVSLQVRDIFNTRKFEYYMEDYNYYQEGSRQRMGRYINFSFSYRFGKLSNDRKKRGSERGEDSDMGGDDMDIKP